MPAENATLTVTVTMPLWRKAVAPLYFTALMLAGVRPRVALRIVSSFLVCLKVGR